MSKSRIGLVVLAATSILIAVVSYRFLFIGLADAFVGMEGHIAARPIALVVHVSLSPVALGIAFIQFLPSLRAAHPAWHRWTGRVYGVAVLLGGVSGLVLAVGASGGPVASWGFGLLSMLWLAVTAHAVGLAMRGRYDAHRAWMVRSFAMTFAAVTLRLYLPVLMFGFQIDYQEASQWLAWVSWVPNLLLAEYWLSRKQRLGALAA